MFWKQKTVEERTVLFVDDDEAILNSLERGLLDETYNKLFAKSCREALEVLRRQQVHVIVTDMRMPDMSGLELLRIIKKEHPSIVGVILSGYDKDTTLQAAVDQGEIFKLIPKPWKLGGNFEEFVRQAIDQYDIQNKSVRSEGGKSKQFKAKLRE